MASFYGDPGKNTMKSESEKGESSREYTNTQSSIKARNDAAGKVPTLEDQMMQIQVRNQ